MAANSATWETDASLRCRWIMPYSIDGGNGLGSVFASGGVPDVVTQAITDITTNTQKPIKITYGAIVKMILLMSCTYSLLSFNALAAFWVSILASCLARLLILALTKTVAPPAL